MFKDLKEYQEITQLYHESVNISEEQRAINTAIAEAEFTAEEIKYLDENFDDLWEGELSTLTEEIIADSLSEENLNEEQIQEIVKKLAPKAAKVGGEAAKGIGGMLKKGFSAVKKAIPQGVKDTVSGAKSVAKSAIKKVGGVVKKVAPKVLKAAPVLGAGGLAVAGIAGGINALRNRGKKEREAAANKVPSTAEIRAKDKAAGGTGMSNIPKAEGNAVIDGKKLNPDFGKKVDIKKEFPDKEKEMSKRDKFNAKFIKKDKGKGFVRRGSPGAQRAENKEKARLKAQAMAKARIEAKKKAQAEVKEEFDAYDMVLMYLNATEQASTVEEANYIMTEMDQQTIGEIVKQVKEALSE